MQDLLWLLLGGLSSALMGEEKGMGGVFVLLRLMLEGVGGPAESKPERVQEEGWSQRGTGLHLLIA